MEATRLFLPSFAREVDQDRRLREEMPPISAMIRACVMILALSIAFAACAEDSMSPRETSSDPNPSAVLFRGAVICAANIDELYAAVNNPKNAGQQIVLGPNVYMLDPGLPHGGRLELQQDMSLRGQPGHPDAVVIDASGLDVASLTDGFLTGAIRVGRGENSIEWLTVRGATAGAAAIETDLVGAGRAQIRIANVVATGNQRGFDIRNIGATMARRTLHADLTDNVLSDNIAGPGQGLRFVNLNTNNSTIHATLRNNVARGNIAGCLGANVNSDSCLLVIESAADRFNQNGNGWVFLAGNASGVGFANANGIRLTAHGGAIQENGGSIPAAQLVGGLLAVGGANAGAAANHASYNILNIELWGVTMRGNEKPDIAAWGGWTPSGGLVGTYNSTSITLHGVTKMATAEGTPSTPYEPGGTNTVTIRR